VAARPHKIGSAFRVLVVLLKPLLIVFTKRDWRGASNIPAEGGLIVVSNHMTYADPLAIGHFLYDNGRAPRFLAKASLFKAPVLGRLLRGAGQIPVHRASKDASLAFRDAVAAVNEGKTIVVYPEGTITRDPDLWPMVGKSGAARIALTTGAPVLPIAQWGAHELLAPYGKKPKLLPRKTMHVIAGPPVDLSDFAGRELTVEVLRTATDRIMDAITAQLAELREARPPATRFVPGSDDKRGVVEGANSTGDDRSGDENGVADLPNQQSETGGAQNVGSA
jgi:1-acyl-sn-glycerol-3-phosphate acyltransferase